MKAGEVISQQRKATHPSSSTSNSSSKNGDISSHATSSSNNDQGNVKGVWGQEDEISLKIEGMMQVSNNKYSLKQ